MKNFATCIFSFAFCLAAFFLIIGCSQTASSANEEEIEPAPNQKNLTNGTKDNTSAPSKDSQNNSGSNPDDSYGSQYDHITFTPDNDYVAATEESSNNTETDIFKSLFSGNDLNVSETSSLEFTGEKVECNFKANDKEWPIDVEKENGVGHSTITFDNKSMKIQFSGSQEDSTASSCETSLATAQLVMAFAGVQDLDMSCDGKTMNFSGTIIDSTRTSADKKDVYNELCL